MPRSSRLLQQVNGLQANVKAFKLPITFSSPVDRPDIHRIYGMHRFACGSGFSPVQVDSAESVVISRRSPLVASAVLKIR
jgi:hypothetical protein